MIKMSHDRTASEGHPDEDEQQALNTRYQALNDEQLFNEGYQKCTKCQNIKRLDSTHFVPSSRYAHNFRRRCRVCENNAAKAWQQEHKERANKKSREWVEANRSYQRERYQKMSDALRRVRDDPTFLADQKASDKDEQ